MELVQRVGERHRDNELQPRPPLLDKHRRDHFANIVPLLLIKISHILRVLRVKHSNFGVVRRVNRSLWGLDRLLTRLVGIGPAG